MNHVPVFLLEGPIRGVEFLPKFGCQVAPLLKIMTMHVDGRSKISDFTVKAKDLQRHRQPFRLQRVLGDVDRHDSRNVDTRPGTLDGSGAVAGRLPLVLDSHTTYCMPFPPTCQGACFG